MSDIITSLTINMRNSIIVPAYNEEKRFSKFIPDLIRFIKKTIPDSELIVVDDGSKDATRKKVFQMIKNGRAERFAKIIGYPNNKGKGNAVSYGVKAAKGDKILFVDADGSIPPEEIPKLLEKLDEYDFVAGSRLIKGAKIKTNFLRRTFSFGFNLFVSILFQYSYRDNLCGFKGFKKEIAKKLFSNLCDKRWLFDVELFYKAKKNNFSVYFLPIEWHHVGGSRINLFTDPPKWFMRLFKLRIHLNNYN